MTTIDPALGEVTNGSTDRRADAARYQRLRWFNLAMGGLHTLQGVLMIALSNDTTLPIDANYLVFNETSQRLEPGREVLLDVRVGWAVASFLFMSALAHLLLSLPGIYDWYVRNLRREINYARWIEYAFSASVMIVIIAMLTGIYDVAALVPIFGINAMMILCGWMMERWNEDRSRVDWTAYVFGCFAGAVPWIPIAIYLFGSGGGESGPPTFVYWIFLSIFLFFNVFAVNMVLQYAKVGRWRDYLFGEYVYIILSLTAKSALAWQVFAGTLQPA
jgi:hypothetical protein